ncbi:uncharacterized protein Z518_02855 [Rhinocladiella mackenziei CBS 650.93]|uniref:Fork-head domain-containing protein n=1 Tax=Rhinocladiella mackenziei CBS 650.93 TaxID=1442369 RepID=A0A0D2IQI1_9EURO|nr:uncharacterized protein Z518_02855 [Rhinocladiella mackenziei CBS 650.93]KIX08199.1 hypothetical protein Z518_02855 [Rhinocladiella mackenziei CBS 650.93]
MENESLPHHCQPCTNRVNSELSRMTSVLSRQNSHPSSSGAPQPQTYSGEYYQEVHPLPKLESLDEWCVLPIARHDSHPQTTTQLQLSDIELGPTWTTEQTYPEAMNGRVEPTSVLEDFALSPFAASNPVSGNCSTYYYFGEGGTRSPWPLPSEFAHCRPLMLVGEDEEASNDKPYAVLIYEALMQAPGHRMLLRDIYEWFRLNTSKPHESGSNGWQNSIRHNLSMNKAFENDRDHSHGHSRKANSAWILTKDAVKNGVQSTTRYRKTGGAKRSLASQVPAIQRQRSGAKGGRAARRAARQRRQERSFVSDRPPSGSPATPSYSDVSNYHKFEYHNLQPAIRSWPMTPVEGNHNLGDDVLQDASLSPLSPRDYKVQHRRFGDESLYVQSLLLRSTGS